MIGVLGKILRESFVMILLFAAGMLLAARLLTHVLPQFQDQVTGMLEQLPFPKAMLSALLGVDVGTELSAQVFQSILWIHPIILALVWGFEVMFCTRFPAGEIDRGTIDVLLGLPVSRRIVFLSESFVWFGAGVLMLSAQFVGYQLGAHAIDAEIRPSTGTLFSVLLNFFGVYVAIGGGAFLVSALCDRRGVAVAMVFALLLASFFINFLARFWEPADALSFLSVLSYYQPAEVITTGTFPAKSMLILFSVGLVGWIAAGEIIARRNICTT